MHPAQIATAVEQMAAAITAELGHRDLLALLVMNGGFIPAAQVLSQLSFPLQVGYLHATRYRSGTRGGDLERLDRRHAPQSRAVSCW